MKPAVLSSLLCALACVPAVVSAAEAPYDRLSAPGVTEVLPIDLAQSVNHSVDAVERDGRYYRFHVDSSFGPFDVTSMALLRERVREIEILATASNRFLADSPREAERQRGQYRLSADSAVDIITRPVTSAGEIAGQVAEKLDETFAGPAPSRVQQRYGHDTRERLEPSAAIHKRNVAFQWGLDPYSGNYAVQNFLNAVARARSGGRISAGAPSLGRGRPSATAIADMDIEFAIASRLKSETPEELVRNNLQLLSEMEIPENLAQAFTGHDFYSLGRQTRIIHYLRAIEGVRGRADFLGAAMGANNETFACAFEQAAIMLNHYHDAFDQLDVLHAGRHLLQAVTQERRILFLAPLDFIGWTASTEQLFDDLHERASGSGYVQWELIVSGTLTDRARKALGERRFVLRERFVEG